MWNKRYGVLVTMIGGLAGVETKHVRPVALLAVLLTASLATALCACAEHGEKKVEENIYPTNYKPGIIARLRLMVEDPIGIRDAYISTPAIRSNGGTNRYIVCVRFNARDANGQYAGNKEVAAFFYAGDMTQIVDSNSELCGGAAYQPFPELQKLCVEAVCKS